MLEDENVDAAIVILTPQAMTDVLETAEIVPRVCRGIDKPVLSSFMGIVDVSEGVKYLEKNGIVYALVLGAEKGAFGNNAGNFEMILNSFHVK